MKNKFFVILIILSIFGSLIGSAAAPLSAPEKAKIERVTLIESTFLKEKGMVFRFKVTGTFTEKDLKGSLLVQGKTIRLRCRYQRAMDLVQCTAPGGTSSNFAGKTAVVSLNGFNFWIAVPSKEICTNCK